MNRNRTSQPAVSAKRIDAAARRLLHCATATPVITLLSGCSSAPSRSILGSYFPSWMLCAIAGMVLALFMKQALVLAGLDKSLPVPLLVYLAFSVAFAFLLWLVWLS